MSAVDSPITPTDSRAGTIQPESTVPSSPMTEPLDQDPKETLKKETDLENLEDREKGKGTVGGDSTGATEDVDDTEGMDTKAKALMHLLKTSSVSCSQCVTRVSRADS